jgi:hypothetical protein
MTRVIWLVLLFLYIGVLICSANVSGVDENPKNYNESAPSQQPAPSSYKLEENGNDHLKIQQEEAIRRKKLEEVKRIREEAVRKTLKASSTEDCDWSVNPLRSLKGEVCGSYYKILGMNRRDSLVDKTNIKKAFRQLSLVLHPDKNPSENAQTAFKLLQEAYECLSDELCKENYDIQLGYAEEKIQWNRHELKNAIIDKVTHGLEMGYNKLSQGANQVVYWGLHIWELVGELKVNVFDEEWQVGRPFLILLLLWKGIPVMQLFGAAYLIVRVNHEIAKGNRML